MPSYSMVNADLLLELELRSPPDRGSYKQDKRSAGLLKPEMERSICLVEVCKSMQEIITA